MIKHSKLLLKIQDSFWDFLILILNAKLNFEFLKSTSNFQSQFRNLNGKFLFFESQIWNQTFTIQTFKNHQASSPWLPSIEILFLSSGFPMSVLSFTNHSFMYWKFHSHRDYTAIHLIFDGMKQFYSHCLSSDKEYLMCKKEKNKKNMAEPNKRCRIMFS